MSAPLVVNTRDGACWTRRTVTAGGIALYAPEAVKTCPEFVMATLPELAERGIVGSAHALPMPVGPEPVPVAEPELDAALGEIAAFLRVRLALESAKRGRRELRAELHTAQAHGRTFLEQRNAHAKELLALRARVAELEAQREAVSARLRKGQRWQEGRMPPLVSQDFVSQDELRDIFGIPLTAPWDEDPWRPCGCPRRFARHADGCPTALRAEDTADLLTLAPAQHADATYNPAFGTISLELTATRAQWSAWQKALAVDLARTTNRGSCTTSHATWRGIHVVIRRWPAEEDVTPQVQKLRTLLAGQREQAAADAPHEGPQRHTYRLGRDLPEAGERS